MELQAAFRPGDLLRDDRYEIERVLRHAPDKDVYIARDRKCGARLVAVDVFSNNASMASGLSVSAWEAQVLGQLDDHPSIGTVIDHWEDDDTAFMVSRYLSGGSLAELIQTRRQANEVLPIEMILDVAIQIATGVEHIHRCGILYRDLQPRNVLFDDWGGAHLVDFDTAVSVSDANQSDISRRSDVQYVAPEGLAGSPVDERADLYSLGATIYDMCCGRPPYGGTREEILAAHAQHQQLSFERTDISEGLQHLVCCLLATAREERPDDAEHVVERLRGLRSARTDLERFLASDETAVLEFKASLRTPIDPRRPGDKRTDAQLRPVLEREAIETVAAFLNSGGGTLLIGVKDDRTVVGIDVDYPNTSGSRDGWRRTFDNLITRDLGAEVMSCVDLQLEPWQGRTIAVVRCRQRGEPTWLGNDLFVRRTASTEKLDARSAVAYCRETWGH